MGYTLPSSFMTERRNSSEGALYGLHQMLSWSHYLSWIEERNAIGHQLGRAPTEHAETQIHCQLIKGANVFKGSNRLFRLQPARDVLLLLVR